MTTTELSEFKGHPVIVIKTDENDEYPFSFGVAKARKVLDSIEQIQAFVDSHPEN